MLECISLMPMAQITISVGQSRAWRHVVVARANLFTSLRALVGRAPSELEQRESREQRERGYTRSGFGRAPDRAQFEQQLVLFSQISVAPCVSFDKGEGKGRDMCRAVSGKSRLHRPPT